MSLIIKGMRMPHSCADCDFARLSMSSTGFATGFVCNCPENDFNNVDCCVQNHIRHRGCALAELPERHGRLVDVDVLIAEWKDVLSTDGISPMFAMVLERAIRDVERAKVVVEAEGEE